MLGVCAADRVGAACAPGDLPVGPQPAGVISCEPGLVRLYRGRLPNRKEDHKDYQGWWTETRYPKLPADRTQTGVRTPRHLQVLGYAGNASRHEDIWGQEVLQGPSAGTYRLRTEQSERSIT